MKNLNKMYYTKNMLQLVDCSNSTVNENFTNGTGITVEKSEKGMTVLNTDVAQAEIMST